MAGLFLYWQGHRTPCLRLAQAGIIKNRAGQTRTPETGPGAGRLFCRAATAQAGLDLTGDKRPVDFTQYVKYNHPMSPRTGRPRTGERPNISIRLDREVYREAKIGAVVAGKTIGQWLEDAIQEKVERDGGTK